MKTISKTALVAIVAVSIGAASFAPAFAQPIGGSHQAVQRSPDGEARSSRPGPGAEARSFHRGSGAFGGSRMQGGLFRMFLSGNAEAIDVAAVRLTHRLELTEDQQALLEDLRLAALDAQSDVATARDEFAPAEYEEVSDSDLIAHYADLVAMTTARAEGLEAVQPAFEAFVSSLDSDQLESLVPQRRDRAPKRSAPATPRAAPDAEG